ncbi:MAG: conjugal transfer protein [Actinomyces succiniciruminis]|nr:conjugal transfer protein [Actinomyces succiniciruminis]
MSSATPRRSGVARAARRALTVLAAVLVLVGALPLSPARANAGTAGPAARDVLPGAVATTVLPADTDDESAGRVTLAVTSLAPQVLGTGEDVTLTGTITNGTDQTLSGATLVAQMQSRTEMTTDGLASWLADEQDTPLATIALETLTDDVAPGAAVDFRLTISADNLPLRNTEQWGPRGIQVALTQGYTTLTQDRTIVLWNPGVQVSPTRVTAFVPVTASPAELLALTAPAPGSLPDDAGTPTPTASATASATATDSGADYAETLAALHERVLGLLELAGDGVVLAVDPALLAVLGVESTAPTSAAATGSPTPSAAADGGPSETADATDLKQALAAAVAAGDVVALPWGDADLTALAHLGETDLLASALQRSADSAAAQAGADTSVAWAAGALDATTLAALPDSVTTVVAAPGDAPVAVDLTYTPSGTMTLDGRTVLIPEAGMSAAIGGSLLTDEGDAQLSDLDAVQLLRGQTAIVTRQAPAVSRDMVVVVPREAAAELDPQVLAQRLTALTNSTWTQPQSLHALLESAADSAQSGAEVARVPLPDSASGQGEVTAMTLSAARAAEGHLDSVASILDDPERALGMSTDVVALAASASWRADESACTTMIAQSRARGEAVSDALAAAPSSTINLISSSADLPVRIVSTLDQDVTVEVHLESSSTRLQTDEDVTVTVPAGGQVTASVPVTAVGSGDVDLTIQLRAQDGTNVGTPSTVHLRVRADWENVGTRVLGGILVILLVAGIIRTVRRGRRTATPRERR